MTIIPPDFCGFNGQISIFKIAKYLPSQSVRTKLDQPLERLIWVSIGVMLVGAALVVIARGARGLPVAARGIGYVGAGLFVFGVALLLVYLVGGALIAVWFLWRPSDRIAVAHERAHAEEDALIEHLRQGHTLGELRRGDQRAKMQTDVFERRAVLLRSLSAAFVAAGAILGLPRPALSILAGGVSVNDHWRLVLLVLALALALMCVGASLFHGNLALRLVRVQFLLEQARTPLDGSDLPTPTLERNKKLR
jgi:uncharacterized membrane protein